MTHISVNPRVQRTGYDLTIAGQPTDGGDATQPQVIVVQNWFEELRRLVPTN